MSAGIVTLTTDFGEGSPYVAQMKGVILAINPDVRLVDISHAVGPQNIRQAALLLEDVTPVFPAETIHVVVVDPGVGSDRKLVYAQFGDQHFVAPDNGCLSRLALRKPPLTIVELCDRRVWRDEVSSTFHGRDIMAPAAARLSLGLDPASLGSRCEALIMLPWPEARILAGKIEGEVVAVDSFGNLVTNITSEMLEGVATDDSVTIRCDEHETHGIYKTYADQPEMTLIALIGSSGKLELAIVNDSAKIMLGCREGDQVTVTW